jgi:hypothetical protein
MIARLPLSQTKPQDKNDEREDATKVPENRTRIGTTLPTLIIWRKKIPQTLRSNHFLLQTKITKKEQKNRTEQRLTVSEHWTWFGTPSWATSETPRPFGPPPFPSLSHSLPLSIWNTTAAAPNSSLENVFYSDDEEQGMDRDLHKKWIFRNRKKAFG